MTNSDTGDIFRKDTVSGELLKIADGAFQSVGINPSTGASFSILDDGNTAIIRTGTSLSRHDTNGLSDVYVWRNDALEESSD